MKNQTVDTIIIGAGASGLMLGALLKNRDFLIIDNNPKIGSKMLISGGGRCNITNDNLQSKNYLGNQRFIRNIIKRFDQNQLLLWLNQRGLTPQLRKDSQYFCKNSAKEIVDLLKREIDNHKIKLQTEVTKVEKKDNIFKVHTNRGIFQAKKVVVATGGLSFPKLGATPIGYDIAKSFGHTISTLNPALVGFTLQPKQFFFKSLSGVSTDVKIKVGEQEIKGSLLFAHKGISGPAILNASLYWQKGKITIDFLPNIKIEQLKSSKKYISNLLGLSNRVAKTFLEQLEIEDKSANKLNNEEYKKIESLKEYSFAPAGTFGYSKAEVTKGGINTDEIDASSMMSKKEENLYFLGELVDVTGELGGYNFQWAFATAYVCSKTI
ncbi:MAG TPA: aminoacetone oxidase family FAD-binding enzyme [Campylobacterales bacterium]|nr:aminoacetone oxidase family FAD-binding enzyme [Campylobacterales bacterium]HHH51930.1 aminoacetone oxidase family FAD-binding enzyme [Campylobacterales bacterium]